MSGEDNDHFGIRCEQRAVQIQFHKLISSILYNSIAPSLNH